MMKESAVHQTFAANLKRLIEEKGTNASRLANYLGVNRSTVSLWLSAQKAPRLDKVDKICQYFGCNRSELLDSPDSPKPSFETVRFQRLPLVGRIPCGKPILAEENIEDYIDVPTSFRGTFCLKCVGDSMVDAGIYDGNIVVIREQAEVENGDIAAVVIDDDESVATLKRVYLSEDVLQLVAANPAYSPLVFVGSDINRVRIAGKAVGVFKTI